MRITIPKKTETTGTARFYYRLMAGRASISDPPSRTLSDLTRMTGMDRSALSKLETGQRLNPTIETLVRFADAVGKRLVVSLEAGPR